MEKLTPGTYRLTADLEALLKDKRRTRDWSFNPIKTGTLFFYTEWTYSPADDGRMVTERRLYPVGRYSSESLSPYADQKAFRKLEALLERIDETPSLWLRREHEIGTGLRVLDALAKAGIVTLETIQNIANRVEKDLDSDV